jgi:hypothetical protein
MIKIIAAIILVIGMTTVCGHIWSIVPGKKMQISASVHYLWGVNSHHQIFMCHQPCANGKWRHIRGRLKQVDVGDHEVWGINKHGYIYKHKVDGKGGWTRVGGRSRHVSASGHGYIYAIGLDWSIWNCKKPCNGRWKKIPGHAKQVDAGFYRVFVVTSSRKVYSRPVDGRGSWKLVKGRFDSITVGGMTVYGIINNVIYRCSFPCNGNWKKMPLDSCLRSPRQIEASVNSLVAVDVKHLTFRQPITYAATSMEAQNKEMELEVAVETQDEANKTNEAENEGDTNMDDLIKDANEHSDNEEMEDDGGDSEGDEVINDQEGDEEDSDEPQNKH